LEVAPDNYCPEIVEDGLIVIEQKDYSKVAPWNKTQSAADKRVDAFDTHVSNPEDSDHWCG